MLLLFDFVCQYDLLLDSDDPRRVVVVVAAAAAYLEEKETVGVSIDSLITELFKSNGWYSCFILKRFRG